MAGSVGGADGGGLVDQPFVVEDEGGPRLAQREAHTAGAVLGENAGLAADDLPPRSTMMPRGSLSRVVGSGDMKVFRFGGQFSDAVGCLAASYISSCCTGVLYPIVE